MALYKAFLPLLFLMILGQQAQARGCVVLLHGVGRTSASMQKLATALKEQGYFVANVDYPSKEDPIEVLAEGAIPAGLRACKENDAKPINFVTHSMGGILVRQYYYVHHDVSELARVVMLAPPNGGTAVIDVLRRVPYFTKVYGVALAQLGTSNEDIAKKLGPVKFSLGVIAGTKPSNYLFSQIMASENDGKVPVASARVSGMTDFTTVYAAHEVIMENDEAIELAIHYLKNGAFKKAHSG